MTETLTPKFHSSFGLAHVVGGQAGVVGEVLDADAVDNQLVLVRMVLGRVDLKQLLELVHFCNH